MSNRPKSPKQQNHDRKQQRKTLASEVRQTYVREEAAPPAPAPKAQAPQAAAPQGLTPQAPAPKVQAPQATVRKERVAQAPAPQALTPQAPAPKVQAPQEQAPVRGSAASPEPVPLPKPQRQLLESVAETMERSLKAAGLGTVAVNRKLIDMARANVASGLDLVKDLATAKNPIEMVRVQMAFCDGRMQALASQAQELSTLSAELVESANEPIREHVRRSLNAGSA